MKFMKTAIYVDGFNLYYGSLKRTRFKWLDMPRLFRTVLQPHHQIQKVKYFTAKVSAVPNNPQGPRRQDIYLRALKMDQPNAEVHLGHFLSHEVRMPLARPSRKRKTVSVIKTQEKGSDVNLAVHLLNDAWREIYDCAVVVTNDSDIAEALRLVKQRGSVRIGVVTPGDRNTSSQLRKYADFVRRIRDNALKQSQLPDPIPNTEIYKPERW